MAHDQVLQLKAVGADVLQGLPPHGRLVALLHLAGAAGGTLVLADLQVSVCRVGWGCEIPSQDTPGRSGRCANIKVGFVSRTPSQREAE